MSDGSNNHLLKNLIETFQNDSILEIRNRKFVNEIIFENIVSTVIFDQLSKT